MSEWTAMGEGNVRFIHHPTTSQVELIVSQNEKQQLAGIKPYYQSIFMDYDTFEDLKKTMKHFDHE